jgi:hypothetical protein
MNILSATEASKHVSLYLTYVNPAPILVSATEDIVGDGVFKGRENVTARRRRFACPMTRYD